MIKYPLVNTQTKSIPIGPSLKSALNAQKGASKVSESETCCDLAVPTLHTNKKILNEIHQLKQENPDITLKLAQKLCSPNTSNYIRKKKCATVNLPESELFQELVSASPSGVVHKLEEDLRRKAIITRPNFNEPDIEPRLEDYFNADENIHIRTVGPCNILSSYYLECASPFRTDHSHVLEDCDSILN